MMNCRLLSAQLCHPDDVVLMLSCGGCCCGNWFFCTLFLLSLTKSSTTILKSDAQDDTPVVTQSLLFHVDVVPIRFP